MEAEALFEESHGCGAPRPLPYNWPLALDIVVNAFRVIAEKQALQWFTDIFERTGPTFEQQILGSKGIDTIEPENLESILSTDFACKIAQSALIITRMTVYQGRAYACADIC